ncbi:MAG: hypothetical protein VCD50_07700 [Alphaproteobacteria bacterium]|jgi:DNA-binding PadR family transcriptional regulator
MFRDKSLMPKEAIRLSALGLLSQGSKSYAALANEVRHFTTRFWGPTLDVMASSIELMRLEGLIEDDEEESLRLTDAGRVELNELLSATVRAEASDFSKLAIALKLRFMHLLSIDEQRDQAESLIEMRQSEAARLIDLRAAHAEEGGHFLRWLDREIDRTQDDLAWLEELRDSLV